MTEAARRDSDDSEFDSIAQSNKQSRCFFCGLPEVEKINQAKRAGHTRSTIIEYLVRKGYKREDVSISRFQSHFYNQRHHELKAGD